MQGGPGLTGAKSYWTDRHPYSPLLRTPASGCLRRLTQPLDRHSVNRVLIAFSSYYFGVIFIAKAKRKLCHGINIFLSCVKLTDTLFQTQNVLFESFFKTTRFPLWPGIYLQYHFSCPPVKLTILGKTHHLTWRFLFSGDHILPVINSLSSWDAVNKCCKRTQPQIAACLSTKHVVWIQAKPL